MQNWTDATPGRLPGYRDRIVPVPLTNIEGGLNLDKPSKRIGILSDRGGEAACELMRHFDIPPVEETMTRDNHRWIHLRSLFASLEKTLGHILTACDRPENNDLGYEAWLQELFDDPAPAPSYEMSKEQIAALWSPDRVDDSWGIVAALVPSAGVAHKLWQQCILPRRTRTCAWLQRTAQRP